MLMLPEDTQVRVDAAAVAEAACRLIVAAAQAAIRKRGSFSLVLAGGTTPTLTYAMLAASPQEWAAWEIFWSDERCLPPTHPGRNSRTAGEAWLDHVAIPRQQIHPIPVELGAEPAAIAYAGLLKGHRPFDMVLLGMGADGHTAALFPGATPHIASVIGVGHAAEPARERVSLNYTSLRDCRRQLVLITGPAKAEALAAWRQGTRLPVALAVCSEACLLIDASLRSAAGFPVPRSAAQPLERA